MRQPMIVRLKAIGKRLSWSESFSSLLRPGAVLLVARKLLLPADIVRVSRPASERVNLD